MNWRRYVYPLATLAFLGFAWQAYGWSGLAVAVTGGVMWILLHFTRMMHVMKQAADRPVGHVGSAVMLNAKLRAGVNLLHVMAITKSLGELLSPRNEQPEVYRWTDAGGSHVTCEFHGGRLATWSLSRPEAPAEEMPGDAPQPVPGQDPAAH